MCLQQRDCGHGVVVDLQLAVGLQIMLVALQEPDEQKGADALIAIGKRVILDDEIEQVRGLLLNAGVEELAA